MQRSWVQSPGRVLRSHMLMARPKQRQDSCLKKKIRSHVRRIPRPLKEVLSKCMKNMLNSLFGLCNQLSVVCVKRSAGPWPQRRVTVRGLPKGAGWRVVLFFQRHTSCYQLTTGLFPANRTHTCQLGFLWGLDCSEERGRPNELAQWDLSLSDGTHCRKSL